MISISETELIRHYHETYLKLDKCRDQSLNIKERIIDLAHNQKIVMEQQPADLREKIDIDLNKISRQLVNLYYSIQTLEIMTQNYLGECVSTSNHKVNTMLTHTKKRFEYACLKHYNNIDIAYELLNITTDRPIFA